MTSYPGSGTLRFTSDTSSVCTVNSSTGLVAFTGAGSCSIYSTLTSDGLYAAATSSPAVFDVTQASRTLSIDALSYNSSYTLAQTAPTLTSTPSAGSGSITFVSVDTNICLVDYAGGTLTFVTAGTCLVNSSISSSGGYAQASSSNISIILSLASRTLAIDNVSYATTYNINDSAPVLTSTASVGSGTITYFSDSPSVCSIDTSTGVVTFIASGTCVLHSSITASGAYVAANSSTISFTITIATTPAPVETSHSASGGSGNSSSNESTSFTPPASPPSNASQPANSPSQAPSQPQQPQICAPYITSFIKLGLSNDAGDVKRLQNFLNEREGEVLVVDGKYKAQDFEAVKRFQVKYKDILLFWNLTAPTGYVFTATQNAINKMYCQQAAPVTCPYFNKYVKEKETSPEVNRIKVFLNNYQNAGLTVSPLYDSALTQAVKNFQMSFAEKTLAPWGLTSPTGRWYQSTRKAANDLLGCNETVRLDNGKYLP